MSTSIDERIPHPTGRARKIVIAIQVILIVGLTACAAFLLRGMLEDRATVSARAAAVAAASDELPKLLTYDAAAIDQVPGVIDAVTTGDFQSAFHTAFDQMIRPNAVQQQASSTATVASASWVDATPDRVTVLLLLDQRTKSTALVGERVDTVQAAVTMVNVDGRWLIGGLDQV